MIRTNFFQSIFFVALAVLCFSRFSDAGQDQYKFDELLASMEAGESRARSLSFDFEAFTAGPNGTITRISRGFYGRDLDANSLRVTYKTYDVDATTGAEQLVLNDDISFDGSETRHLSLRRPKAKRKTFYRNSGFNSEVFDIASRIHPLGRMWQLGTKRIVDVCRDHKDRCNIESTDFKVEGLSTVKLNIDYSDKKIPYIFELWICPDRDFMCVKRQLTNNGVKYPAEVMQDFIQLPDGSWWPLAIIAQFTEKPVTILTFSNISNNKRPVEFFNIKVPRNTEVIDQVDGLKYITAP